MPRVGCTFEIILKEVHLGWGKVGQSRATMDRSVFEVYLPISSDNARKFSIYASEVFEAISDDGYYSHNLKASGSQGSSKRYGKNFQSEGDLRKLGYWLKDRRSAKPGDKVIVEFITDSCIKLYHKTS